MEVIRKKQSESAWGAAQHNKNSSKQENQEQNNQNIQVSPSKTGAEPKEPESTWKNTLSSKRLLDFDSINHDGSIFEDDPDSETENAKGNQEHGKKPVRRNLHNGPPTSSLDREIQIHHEK